MIPFAAYTAAETTNVFQWAERPPKTAPSHGDLYPHLIHDFLGPLESATQTASRFVQPFCKAHEREQQTNKPTDHVTVSEIDLK